MSLIVVDWEGGALRRVGIREWWRFVTSHPSRLTFPNPEMPMAASQAKCFAGVFLVGCYFGYDFILGRHRRNGGALRPLAEWRGHRIAKEHIA